jgi:hypothetical protein
LNWCPYRLNGRAPTGWGRLHSPIPWPPVGTNSTPFALDGRGDGIPDGRRDGSPIPPGLIWGRYLCFLRSVFTAPPPLRQGGGAVFLGKTGAAFFCVGSSQLGCYLGGCDTVGKRPMPSTVTARVCSVDTFTFIAVGTSSAMNACPVMRPIFVDVDIHFPPPLRLGEVFYQFSVVGASSTCKIC